MVCPSPYFRHRLFMQRPRTQVEPAEAVATHSPQPLQRASFGGALISEATGSRQDDATVSLSP